MEDGTKREGGKRYGFTEYWLYTEALNWCLSDSPEIALQGNLAALGERIVFSPERCWLCLSGVTKKVYHGVFHCTPTRYMELFERFRARVDAQAAELDYRANSFMVLEQGAKQLGVLFSAGDRPRCAPEELAARIQDIGQALYEEEIFRGDTRYFNVTALSGELHGVSEICVGYQQVRALNDLSFFHMGPGVLTARRLDRLRNDADYPAVMEGCALLCQALDAGNADAARACLDELFLRCLKHAYSWALLQDALSSCKHMLQLRRTARGLSAVDLDALCAMEGYLRIEDCVDALWPVMEEVCAATRAQGPLSELALKSISYIRLHYAEDISRPEIAAYANVNPNYLSGAFQEETGMSLREYITVRRMEEARRLLTATFMRVADIAEAVGIHDVKYFTQLFKKQTGTTPAEYRAAHRKG